MLKLFFSYFQRFKRMIHELLFDMIRVSIVGSTVLPQRMKLLETDTLKLWRCCWQIKRT
jgi:hypothetical protein